MKYYILDRIVRKKDLFIEKSESTLDSMTWKACNGKSLEEELPFSIKYYDDYPKKKLLDYLPGCYGLTVSEKLMDLCIDLEPNNLEIYPTELLGKKKRKKKYFFLNIINNIDAFDWDNSEYKVYANTKTLSRVEKLILNDSSIGNRNIFRVSSLESLIFVSEKFKELIEESSISGIGFKEISDYTKNVY